MEKDSEVGTKQAPLSFWIKGSTSGLASALVPSRIGCVFAVSSH